MVDISVECTAVCGVDSTRKISALSDAKDSLVPESWCNHSERRLSVINFGVYLQKALPEDHAFDFIEEIDSRINECV